MSKVMDVKCPTCNAVLKYNAKLQTFKCEFCNNTFKAEDIKTTQKEDAKSDADSNYVSYNCSQCGSEIVADDQTSATFCLYCGNTAILRNKLSGEFKPSYLIPFKVDRNDAVEAFKNINKGKPFIPDSFNSEKNIEKITGLYVPFWLYEIQVKGELQAKCVNVTTWSRGDTTYVKEDTYMVTRDGEMVFNKVPVDGSTRFEDNIMNTIEPYDYSGLIPYDPAYLSGFFAERYDIKNEELFNIAADRSINSAKEVMLKSMPYNQKTISKNELVASKNNVEYALLPVWMVNVKFKDNYYLFAMNGQTGEFVGNVPVDPKKALFKTLKIFVLVALSVLAIFYALYLFGGVHL